MSLFDPRYNSRRTSELARAFGVTARTVRRWCTSGRLPAVKTEGGHWRLNDRYPDVPPGERPDENQHRRRGQPHAVPPSVIPNQAAEADAQDRAAAAQVSATTPLAPDLVTTAQLEDLADRINRAELARTAETAAREAYAREVGRQQMHIRELEREISMLRGDSAIIQFADDRAIGGGDY